MYPSYHLVGTFIEACNCQVICPCWVDDEPDEDFCAGLFAWTFADGSSIGGHDVSGRSVVSASVHSDGRRGRQTTSVVFTDAALAAEPARLLGAAFAGRGGGPLAQLAGVTGEVRLIQPGRISRTEDAAGGWDVRVEVQGASLIHVAGTPRTFEDSTQGPLKLTGTALHPELCLQGEVTASAADLLQIDVSALLSPSIDYRGRSGMSGRFRYDFDGDPGDGD